MIFGAEYVHPEAFRFSEQQIHRSQYFSKSGRSIDAGIQCPALWHMRNVTME